MPPTFLSDLPWPDLLALSVPLLFLATAILAGRTRVPVCSAWGLAGWSTRLALILAGGSFVWAMADGRGNWELARLSILLLVGFIGWVLARYSATYLAGEPRQQRFVRWFLGTLAGASAVVVTQHLMVLVLAWLGTSLCLQQLLTYYSNRTAAQMAAYKKFLVSRTADFCMLLAAVLLWRAFGVLDIPTLMAEIQGAGVLPADVVIAAVLVALATLLKSAQLPFHGWLMQVMEAPTPVSALLHAGVVNLGGLVLIRLAPLVSAVPAAQWILVGVGGLTAAVAALVMTTRISIKVSLAWSTCAQMGFMLVQCGLGLFEMALLHLLAHSLYKAHAFLVAGATVHRNRVKAMADGVPAQGALPWLATALAGVALVTGAALWTGVVTWEQPELVAMVFVLGLAVTPLLGAGSSLASTGPRALGAGLLVATGWLGLHHLLHGLLPNPAPGAAGASPWLAGWVVGCFAVMFILWSVASRRGASLWAQRLHAWLHGGLFLDERMTRFTLSIWPHRTGALR